MMLSDVCRVHPVGGRRVRRAGWMARIGWSDRARPAWLKAAAAHFRCRPGRGHIVTAARQQLACLVFVGSINVNIHDNIYGTDINSSAFYISRYASFLKMFLVSDGCVWLTI